MHVTFTHLTCGIGLSHSTDVITVNFFPKVVNEIVNFRHAFTISCDLLSVDVFDDWLDILVGPCYDFIFLIVKVWLQKACKLDCCYTEEGSVGYRKVFLASGGVCAWFAAELEINESNVIMLDYIVMKICLIASLKYIH